MKWELMCSQFACTSSNLQLGSVLAVLLSPLIWSISYRFTVRRKIEPGRKLVWRKINLNCLLPCGVRLMFHPRARVFLLQQDTFKMKVLLTPHVVNACFPSPAFGKTLCSSLQLITEDFQSRVATTGHYAEKKRLSGREE